MLLLNIVLEVRPKYIKKRAKKLLAAIFNNLVIKEALFPVKNTKLLKL